MHNINDVDDSDRNTIREVDDGHRRLQEHSRLTSRYIDAVVFVYKVCVSMIII